MSTYFYDSKGRAAHVADLTKVVRNANSEVLAVTWPSDESESDASRGLADARRAYFDVLLQRCKNGQLRYTRILQMADSRAESVANAIAASFDPLYIEHFHHMLEAKGWRDGAAPGPAPDDHGVVHSGKTNGS